MNRSSSKITRTLIAVSLVLFTAVWLSGASRMAKRVQAQNAFTCSPGQTHITKKSGNGTICTNDLEVQFNNGSGFVPAFVVDPNALFFAYHTIDGTSWVAMNCNRTGADNSDFFYRTSFTLPASFSSPSLRVLVHSDNQAEIFLNGTSIGAQPFVEDPASFQDPPESFSTSNGALFLPGANTISFKVHNFGAGITALDFLADICFTPAQGCVDDHPPAISCTVAQNQLWPPNHDLEDVGLRAKITDDCDCFKADEHDGDDDDDDDDHHGSSVSSVADKGNGAGGSSVSGNSGGKHDDGDDDDDDDDDDDHGDCNHPSGGSHSLTITVYSDEPDLDIPGSGNFSPDAKNIGLGSLRLRSERSGNADGRVYLIVVKATDASGKTGYCAKTVTVPKDQSTASKNSVRNQANAALAYFTANHAPPANFVQVGTGPVAGPKQ